jgi:endonuclease/exonuclease/phosphatase family metal-dependent hydrolase
MKFLTLNLRHDADLWPERSRLVLEGMAQENPDIIALQEVSLRINQAFFIKNHLNQLVGENRYQYFLEPKWGANPVEGIAFLTSLNVLSSHRLELLEGERVAQTITLEEKGLTFNVTNTHLHHLPVNDETIRLKQVERLLMDIEENESRGIPTILLGDFNATPRSKTVSRILNTLSSAHLDVHRFEPEYTFPTPLVSEVGDWFQPRTLDYIFYHPAYFSVDDAGLVFTEPDSVDKRLYASDHFGIRAILHPRSGQSNKEII